MDLLLNFIILVVYSVVSLLLTLTYVEALKIRKIRYIILVDSNMTSFFIPIPLFFFWQVGNTAVCLKHVTKTKGIYVWWHVFSQNFHSMCVQYTYFARCECKLWNVIWFYCVLGNFHTLLMAFHQIFIHYWWLFIKFWVTFIITIYSHYFFNFQ